MVVAAVAEFGQQLFQGVAAPRHRHVASPEAGSGAEVVPAVAHVKYPLVLGAGVAALRQVQLQDLPLAQVGGALLAVVRMVVLHLHDAALVDASRVGEDAIDRRAELRRLEDPLDEHGVGVGDDDAVDQAFVFQDKGEQVGHPGRQGDGLHHAADTVGTDLLLPCTHAKGGRKTEGRLD